MSSTTQVTVVVPARNEAGTIQACLEAIFRQDLEDIQVIVVDNGSTDGTRELLERITQADERLELLFHTEPSIPRSLNMALDAARGKYLVRIDAHSRVPSNYVRRAVDRLSEGQWVGVGGRKDAVASSATGETIAAVLGSRLGVGGSVYHHGVAESVVDHVPFGAYPTALVRELGGWDEKIANNEDFELDQRLRRHGLLLFDPALRIEWCCRESIRDLFRQYRRYGTGKPAVALRHPASIKPRHLAPPALVLWLLMAAGIAVKRPGRAAAAIAPYLVAVAGASAVTVRSLPASASRAALPAAFVAMHIGWGLGFLQGVGRVLRACLISRLVRGGSRRATYGL